MIVFVIVEQPRLSLSCIKYFIHFTQFFIFLRKF